MFYGFPLGWNMSIKDTHRECCLLENRSVYSGQSKFYEVSVLLAENSANLHAVRINPNDMMLSTCSVLLALVLSVSLDRISED